MNPFATRIAPKDSWVIPVSLLSVVLGFMMAAAWVTDKTRPSRLALLEPDQQQRVSAGTIDLQQESQKLASEVAKLREENTKLQNSLAGQTGSSQVLNDMLQEIKAFAGLTDMQGPGVVVTLRDSQKPPQAYVQDQIIHDGDVLRVVNELWNAGAEAISVNGHRWVASTSCRCVGSTILVNNTPIASPILVRAVGDPATLTGALNLPAGVLAEFKSVDPAMVQMDTVKMMTLPAFTGSTSLKVGKVPPSKK